MTDNGWKPIETAPKDGTEILICNVGNYDATIGLYGAMDIFGIPDSAAEQIPEETFWAESWWTYGLYGIERLEGDVAPTHWQSLPKQIWVVQPAPANKGE